MFTRRVDSALLPGTFNDATALGLNSNSQRQDTKMCSYFPARLQGCDEVLLREARPGAMRLDDCARETLAVCRAASMMVLLGLDGNRNFGWSDQDSKFGIEEAKNSGGRFRDTGARKP